MDGVILQLLLRHVAVKEECLHVAQLHHRLDVLPEQRVAETRLRETLQGTAVEPSRSHEHQDAGRGRESLATRLDRLEILGLRQTEISELG